MIRRSISCSWCHHMNNLDDPTVRHCANCGHRADVPRLDCDCPKCRPTPDRRAEQKRLDRESMRYLHAIDTGDFDTLAAMWDAAGRDADLAEMMHGLNAELVKEQDGQKVYRGFRFEAVVVVMVGPYRLDPGPSLKVWNHSPTGFEWGYGGSGPAQLALAILLDVTGDAELAQDHYQRFKAQHVAGWGSSWSITEAEVRAWLADGLTRAE
jgi:hypothetical protein